MWIVLRSGAAPVAGVLLMSAVGLFIRVSVRVLNAVGCRRGNALERAAGELICGELILGGGFADVN
jgi:hypothetical protein